MKRVSMTKKKTKRLTDYEREFEKMKTLVHERSKGKCEGPDIARRYLVRSADSESVQAFDSYMGWHEVMCDGIARHVHHRKYRGNSRGGTNSLDNLAHLSIACHDHVHAHGGFGKEANLIGLALSAGESEEL